jgi:hypothetical protein
MNNKINDEVVKEEWFTSAGQQEFFDAEGFPVTSSEKMLSAKKVVKKKNNGETETLYLIRLNTDNDPFTLQNHTEYKDKTSRMISDIRYKIVREDVFDIYKNYLKTNQQVYLKEVQKRII